MGWIIGELRAERDFCGMPDTRGQGWWWISRVTKSAKKVGFCKLLTLNSRTVHIILFIYYFLLQSPSVSTINSVPDCLARYEGLGEEGREDTRRRSFHDGEEGSMVDFIKPVWLVHLLYNPAPAPHSSALLWFLNHLHVLDVFRTVRASFSDSFSLVQSLCFYLAHPFYPSICPSHRGFNHISTVAPFLIFFFFLTQQKEG